MRIVGIGVDLVKVARIEKAIERWNDRFLKHVFTGGEIEYCRRHVVEGIHFAARFAAKEAFRKAAGGKLRWSDVEITNEDGGKPTVRFVTESLHRNADKWRIFLSLSHTEEYAIAYVVITAVSHPEGLRES